MPSTTKLFGAAIVAGTIAFAGSAFAQGKPATKPAAPQPAQAQPAPQGGGQPQGPMRVELQPSQSDWTKVCGKDQAAGKEVCYTTRDFGTQADQPPVLAIAVYDVKGEDTRIVRFLMPIGLMLRPGFRFMVDKGAAIEGAYEICFPNGCFAEAKVKQATVDGMKKGQQVQVAVKNGVGAEVNFVVPLDGFGKAFDGPAIDPKVLEEQQKQLQEQLQKKAEEERKKLEAQKAGAGAAPAPAPAAPAAPKQ
jgi:invasion protein IalB